MPRNRMQKVYSIYHHMEENGAFETNPANAGAVNNDGISLYAGPVEYPKMLYHPTGEIERIHAGIQVMNKEGDPVKNEDGSYKYAGSQYGVKYVTVNNEEEEAEWVGKGWHHNEAAARRLNPTTAKTAQGPSPNELMKARIQELEEKLAAQEAAAKALPKVGALTK